MRAQGSSLAGAWLAALLVLASGCATTPIHQKPWIEARTASFEIASCMSREDTLELARNLELFRS